VAQGGELRKIANLKKRAALVSDFSVFDSATAYLGETAP
jgi:hypothetical protein